LLSAQTNAEKQDLFVYLIGGSCCPRQNIQLNLFNGKITIKKQLPQDCFQPVCTVCKSLIFVAPSININCFEEVLEYNYVFDKWTKLINPYRFESSLNYLENKKQTPERRNENKKRNLISVYGNKNQLNIVIIERKTITFLLYDTTEAIWSSPTVTNIKEENVMFWRSYLTS